MNTTFDSASVAVPIGAHDGIGSRKRRGAGADMASGVGRRPGIAVRAGSAAVALCLASLVMAGAGQAQAASSSGVRPSVEQMQQMREKMRAHVQEELQVRLEVLSRKLALLPAQQGAWQNFTAVVRAMPEPPAPPAADADAAALARGHATALAEHARHASSVADAVAQLQAVLSPEQRVTLNQAARRLMRGGPGMHGGHGFHGGAGPHGHHEGMPEPLERPSTVAPRS